VHRSRLSPARRQGYVCQTNDRRGRTDAESRYTIGLGRPSLGDSTSTQGGRGSLRANTSPQNAPATAIITLTITGKRGQREKAKRPAGPRRGDTGERFLGRTGPGGIPLPQNAPMDKRPPAVRRPTTVGPRVRPAVALLDGRMIVAPRPNPSEPERPTPCQPPTLNRKLTRRACWPVVLGHLDWRCSRLPC
jgi:hypothetical protein